MVPITHQRIYKFKELHDLLNAEDDDLRQNCQQTTVTLQYQKQITFQVSTYDGAYLKKCKMILSRERSVNLQKHF